MTATHYAARTMQAVERLREFAAGQARTAYRREALHDDFGGAADCRYYSELADARADKVLAKLAETYQILTAEETVPHEYTRRFIVSSDETGYLGTFSADSPSGAIAEAYEVLA